MTTLDLPVPLSTTPRRTLREALRSAEAHLTASGVPSPRVDAELLAAHLLRVSRGGLWQHLSAGVPTGFDDLVSRRAQRIPLQHLTGCAHFRTVTLAVGPGVFTPRPESELVVGRALDLLRQGPAEPLVVDLCAGSGALAAAIATEAPQSRVHAVELDPGARPWLLRNAREHGFRAHLTSIEGCLAEFSGQVDVVVANPPYIPESCVPRDPEVARYDPPTALYSGSDGLEHMRLVEQDASRLLRPGGWVVVEHGDVQGETAPAVFATTGRWTDVVDHVDLSGRDRYLVARRAEA